MYLTKKKEVDCIYYLCQATYSTIIPGDAQRNGSHKGALITLINYSEYCCTESCVIGYVARATCMNVAMYSLMPGDCINSILCIGKEPGANK